MATTMTPGAAVGREVHAQRGDAGFWLYHDRLFARDDALSEPVLIEREVRNIHRSVGTVVFTVGEGNVRSRKAMAKIGGVLRPGTELRLMAGEMKPHVLYEIRR